MNLSPIKIKMKPEVNFNVISKTKKIRQFSCYYVACTLTSKCQSLEMKAILISK